MSMELKIHYRSLNPNKKSPDTPNKSESRASKSPFRGFLEEIPQLREVIERHRIPYDDSLSEEEKRAIGFYILNAVALDRLGHTHIDDIARMCGIQPARTTHYLNTAIGIQRFPEIYDAVTREIAILQLKSPEQEIYRLKGSGMSIGQIAQILNVEKSTVKKTVDNMRKKGVLFENRTKQP